MKGMRFGVLERQAQWRNGTGLSWASAEFCRHPVNLQAPGTSASTRYICRHPVDLPVPGLEGKNDEEICFQTRKRF